MVQIILCDPEQEWCGLLQETLTKIFFEIEECHIATCKTGEELLRILMEGASPDLIFLDAQTAQALRLRHFQTELVRNSACCLEKKLISDELPSTKPWIVYGSVLEKEVLSGRC